MENIFPATSNNSNNNNNSNNKRQPYKHPKSPQNRSPNHNNNAQSNSYYSDVNNYKSTVGYHQNSSKHYNSPTYQNQRYNNQRYSNAPRHRGDYEQRYTYSPNYYPTGRQQQQQRRRRFNSNYRPYSSCIDNRTKNEEYDSNNRTAKQPRTSQNVTSTSAQKQSAPIVDFTKLPNVVLTKVFSYLSLTDRLNASIVCKSWRAGLYNPSLWHKFNLIIYLLNRSTDIKSASFKSSTLSKYANNLNIKYDPHDLHLVESLVSIVSNLNETSSNLKCLSLTPMLNFLNESEAMSYNNEELDYYNYYHGYNNHHYQTRSAPNTYSTRVQHFGKLNEGFFRTLGLIILGAKSFEHLSLGCMSDLCRADSNLVDLLLSMSKRHLFNLKSLHVSTIRNSSIQALKSNKHNAYLKGLYDNAANAKAKKICEFSRTNPDEVDVSEGVPKKFLISNLLCQFVNLTLLSIDYEDLSNEFLRSTVCLLSLKK
jgi:hypothetical protein